MAKNAEWSTCGTVEYILLVFNSSDDTEKRWQLLKANKKNQPKPTAQFI